MEAQTPKTVYLKDYTKPDYLIPSIDLEFDLYDKNTKIKSKMKVVKNTTKNTPLVFSGENLKLKNIQIDGNLLKEDEYEIKGDSLVIPVSKESFIVEIENEMDPIDNKALDGLYKSGGIFCTQNEPEGFRRITYFIDRPDIMSKFKTKVIADKTKYPVLLSNGNPVDKGNLGDRHFVTWEDPFAKPCYLFALVAGDLGSITDIFKTMSGKEVALEIYCDKGNEYKCSHAMESLKKSMKWDEDTFGLEYDLDIYMIVAVDSFNMGAMENKGLNIFNSKYVLADPKTATDSDFMGVEGVIGHEYFHNWTGNRVTCRDWFQLTLKEGLTVFRDQEFSADMNSRSVNRIGNVGTVRVAQFVEDAGPMAHPIKPKSYIEINNFYTSTVYYKGAEIIRMVYNLIGVDNFKKGITKYFELYDGQAVTTEDFLNAMTISSGYDFKQFKNWYHQAGTPTVEVKSHYIKDEKIIVLTLSQSCQPTPGQKEKQPFVIPFKVGVIDKDGNDVINKTEILTDQTTEVKYKNIETDFNLSLNRDFSAPVKVKYDYSIDDLCFLMAHDKDDFNRYEAANILNKLVILSFVNSSEDSWQVKDIHLNAYRELLEDKTIDNTFKSHCMSIPSVGTLYQEQKIINIEKTYKARKFLIKKISNFLRDDMLLKIKELGVTKEYSFNADSIGERSLKNFLLGLINHSDGSIIDTVLYESFKNANNMTDEFAALVVLANRNCEFSEKAISEFYIKWKDETLVMQKWLMAQANSSLDGTLFKVKQLQTDPVYDSSVPNLVRSLVGMFAANSDHFHKADGSGYEFIGDEIIKLDPINPQTASMLAAKFNLYKRLDSSRQEKIKTQLERIIKLPSISKNSYEVIKKILD